MGQDAVALLRIPIERLPKKLAKYAEPRGDAVLYSTFNRTRHHTPDQHAWLLREALGKAFALHDDPRGVLLFSDVSAPTSIVYDAIVRELALDAQPWGVAVRCDVAAGQRLYDGGIDAAWLLERGATRGAFTRELMDALEQLARELASDLGGAETTWKGCLTAVAVAHAEGRVDLPSPLPPAVSAVPAPFDATGWGAAMRARDDGD